MTMGTLAVGLIIGLVIGSSMKSSPSATPPGGGATPVTGDAAVASRTRPPATVTVTATVTGTDAAAGAVQRHTQANGASARPAVSRHTRNNSSAKLTVLGAGTFTVGVDVPPGRYLITPKPGESGNLNVSSSSDPLAINEILGSAGGFGVPSVTTTLTGGETIEISGLSHVTFAPAVTRLRTALGAGTWTVGLDIAAGRYIAVPGHGESGNFFVYDPDGLPVTDEILGDTSLGGVPSVTVSLSDGEQVDISGIATVNFTAK